MTAAFHLMGTGVLLFVGASLMVMGAALAVLSGVYLSSEDPGVRRFGPSGRLFLVALTGILIGAAIWRVRP